MVVDTIKNANLYYGMGERMEKAFKYLQENDFSKVEPGRYEVDGDRIYALVQEYQTKPKEQGKWESHKRYIDIQYVVSGEENMGYTAADGLRATVEYNTETDITFFQGAGSMVLCKTGTFIIFLPGDAHMPCLAANMPTMVKKIVMKIYAG